MNASRGLHLSSGHLVIREVGTALGNDATFCRNVFERASKATVKVMLNSLLFTSTHMFQMDDARAHFERRFDPKIDRFDARSHVASKTFDKVGIGGFVNMNDWSILWGFRQKILAARPNGRELKAKKTDSPTSIVFPCRLSKRSLNVLVSTQDIVDKLTWKMLPWSLLSNFNH